MIDLDALAKECGLEFYDDEIVNENGINIYRVYVCKKNSSPSLDECAKFSNLISPILDVKPPLNGAYTLEVSSPGLERKLKKIEHFKKSIGELVRIKTIDNEKIEGTILEVSPNDDIKIDDNIIKFSDIKSAKIFINW